MASYVLIGLVALIVVAVVVGLTTVTARAVAGAVDRADDTDAGVPWLLFLVCIALIGPVACILGVRVVVALVNSFA